MPEPDESLDEVWNRHGREMSEADFRRVIEVQREERASWAEHEHAKQRKKAERGAKNKE